MVIKDVQEIVEKIEKLKGDMKSLWFKGFRGDDYLKYEAELDKIFLPHKDAILDILSREG